MNYLNPHTHDLSGDQPKGLWIARPECVLVHDPHFANKEITDLGWRDRGPGYDHEHFDRIRIEPAEDTDDQPFGGEPERTLPAQKIDLATLPQYKANIVISNAQTGALELQLEIKGNAYVLASVISWAADAFKEDQER